MDAFPTFQRLSAIAGVQTAARAAANKSAFIAIFLKEEFKLPPHIAVME